MKALRLIGMLLLGVLRLCALSAQELRGEMVRPMDAGGVSAVCDTALGTLFNLEPRTNAEVQIPQAVDVLRNGVVTGVDLVAGGSSNGRFFEPSGSGSGYFVSRDADCSPEFEGGLPSVGDSGGGGIPMVVADPVQDAVFMADEFFDLFSAGIVVFRSSASTLLSFAAYPNGTHSAAQVATCWPTQAVDGGFCPMPTWC